MNRSRPPQQKSLLTSHSSGDSQLAETTTLSQSEVDHQYLSTSEQRLVIRASAGTGKTFQLSNRYLTLLRGSSADRILASTFTRKAAGEITDRVLLRLAKAAIDRTEFESLRPFTGTPELTQEECLKLLKEFTQNLHRIRICTLDGFFARLAGSFSLELHLAPGWRLMDEIEASHLQDRAIDSVLREGDVQELKTLMYQLDQGRTRRSVHDLISDHISSFHEIFLRSTPAAWNPFGRLKMPTVAEIESSIAQLAAIPIDNSRMQQAREGDLQRAAAEDWEKLYTSGLLPKVLGEGKYYGKKIPADVQSAYTKLDRLIRAKWLTPWAEQNAATYHLLSRYDAVYEQLKRETSGLRFDDITRRLSQSFEHHSTGDLEHRLDGTIDHVLLDEFQDTSVSQWNVIRLFAEDTTQDEKKSFFCVGDGKQAIYGWRGGEASIFDTIRSQLQNLAEQPLNKSFRSAPVVIDVVNQVFRGMAAHDGLEAELTAVQNWSSRFPIHETAKTELPGYFQLCTSPIPAGQQPDELSRSELTEELNRFVAAKIERQLKACPQGTIGVLTRSNQRIGELIFELNRLGVDASEEGGNPLTDSAGVQLLLALFHLADHPGDSIARFHVAQSPLGRLLGYPDHLDQQLAQQFACRLRQQLLNDGFGKVVDSLVQKLVPHTSRRELRRLTQLTALADDFDVLSHSLRATEFVEFVEQQRVQEPTDSRVRVMTIHQSKGLQFDTVIYAECDGPLTRTPSYLSRTSAPGEPPDVVALYRSQEFFVLFPKKLQQAYQETTDKLVTEALCLLYVALTRAIHSLHVITLPRIAKGKEKHLPKSAAGLIRAALAPTADLESNVTLYEQGDPHWYSSMPAAKAEQADIREPRRLSIRFKKSASTRRFTRVAPSAKKQSASVQLKNILSAGDASAFERGTLFHAWMEEIHWLDDGLPTASRLREIGIRLSGPAAPLDKWISEYYSMLERSALKQLLTKSNYTTAQGLNFGKSVCAEILSAPCELQVRNERHFAIRDGANLVTGSLDRLVTISRGPLVLAADIIDFKTDSLPNDLIAVNERVAYYRGQMETYMQAVEKFYQLSRERISAKIVLLKLGRVICIK